MTDFQTKNSPLLEIPHSLAGDEYGVEYSKFSQQPMQSQLAFWDSLHPWFHEHGYTLYTRDDTNLLPSILKTPLISEDPYPYAVVEADYVPNPWRLSTTTYGNVCFAQEQEGNHVAIKYIQAGSQEYEILRLIFDSGAHCVEENCLIPVLALLPEPDGPNWFVVMPRWGGPGELQERRDRTVGDLLLYIESTVKALAFLHAHNIVHRDIKTDNLFPNRIKNSLMEPEGNVWREGLMRYATADFDLSLILPRRVGEQRLSWKYTRHSYSILTGHYAPRDIYKGELTYDPYTFDVGMLGGMLSLQVQKLHINAIPLLAPLLDKMTTHKVDHRFTAAEALDFVRYIKQQHTHEVDRPLEQRKTKWGNRHTDPVGYDRWEQLPPEFVQHWTSKGYRTPKLSWSTKVIRCICGLKLAGTRIEIGRYPLMGFRRVCNTMGGKFK